MKALNKHIRLMLVGAALAAAPALASEPPSPEAVVTTYANIALAAYEDSLKTAEALDAAVGAFIANPSPTINGKAVDASEITPQLISDVLHEAGEAYDQMIGEGNDAGNALVQAAIDGLIEQTRSIERAIAALDLGTVELEWSDSLDNPNAVFE